MADNPSSFVIQNARIANANDIYENAYIHVENGRFVGVGDMADGMPSGMSVLDAEGGWIVPGFIDMHVHGGDGADVMDGTESSIEKIGRFHARYGTTAWLPTTLTAPIPSLKRSLSAVEAVKRKQASEMSVTSAQILGVHLEGPFITESRRGAQNPEYILPPSVDEMADLAFSEPNLIRKVTIAPELHGALDVIAWLKEHGIVPSIGHTDATLAETLAGVHAGANHATHMYNGMRGLHHREGGTVGGCLLTDDIRCELIVDGHHVDFDVVKLTIDIKGVDNIMLITDAMAATGQPDGRYQLGGLDVDVKDGVALLVMGHNLAGSTLTMDKAFQNVVRTVGVDMTDAVRMASLTPAKEFGIADIKGSIEVGKDADFVILSPELYVTQTFIRGQQVYKN